MGRVCPRHGHRGRPLNWVVSHNNMAQPLEIDGVRICVLRHPDEVVICANPTGFRALGEWMAWLCESDPKEFYHFHLLLHLESEASKFDGVRPRNVWFLDTPKGHSPSVNLPDGATAVPFELTFQVLDEASLDELAEAQLNGVMPPKYVKTEVSYDIQCG